MRRRAHMSPRWIPVYVAAATYCFWSFDQSNAGTWLASGAFFAACAFLLLVDCATRADR